jgi:hypothetical protein
MEVAVLDKKGKQTKVFRITLTCEHCREIMSQEKRKDDAPEDAGVINNCSICQAKICCNVELYEMEEEEDDISGETAGDNQS